MDYRTGYSADMASAEEIAVAELKGLLHIAIEDLKTLRSCANVAKQIRLALYDQEETQKNQARLHALREKPK